MLAPAPRLLAQRGHLGRAHGHGGSASDGGSEPGQHPAPRAPGTEEADQAFESTLIHSIIPFMTTASRLQFADPGDWSTAPRQVNGRHDWLRPSQHRAAAKNVNQRQ
jgi:hypothetical protein